MTRILEFRGAAFAYRGREILRDATFALTAGTATALIGPNGAGKTTLLRLATGVLRPIRGSIVLDGTPIAQRTVKQAAQTVAVVPQHLEVPFDLTVEQIVEQGRTPHLSTFGRIGPQDHAAVDRALDLTDTSTFRKHIFNELSGGERQRVKIALALAQEPRLLLLDEPTQNLDIGRQSDLLRLLTNLRIGGLTILAAIHDLHLIPQNFSSVILLEPNEAPQIGPQKEMLDPARIEQAFRINHRAGNPQTSQARTPPSRSQGEE